jgi:hypothetical protein
MWFEIRCVCILNIYILYISVMSSSRLHGDFFEKFAMSLHGKKNLKVVTSGDPWVSSLAM